MKSIEDEKDFKDVKHVEDPNGASSFVNFHRCRSLCSLFGDKKHHQ